ncbi:YtxH domain-containing protein [Mesonia aestuariivivens]|uniref:YtxH domain-containing protein n=1 Tax=Mesonia aestuariivivens TaxID=2796128 RepID=A0ABS6W0T0_9FLAO|nr:YtxH domain-containing protein [Mesonia aestuariivivens]MBW2961432.1 YtxH domain-containing protein [Mesonia aestuariivivens]
MKTGKVLIGIVTGALAGAAAGILLAPKKGADTRKEIASTSNDYVKGAKGKLDGVKNSIEHKLEALKARKDAAIADSKGEEIGYKAKAELHNAAS